MKKLFEFRNTIAHGKPKDLEKDTLEDVDGFLDAKLGEQIQTEWERFGTEQNAVKAKEDLYKIANLLYKASRLKRKKPKTVGPFAFGFSHSSATITQP